MRNRLLSGRFLRLGCLSLLLLIGLLLCCVVQFQRLREQVLALLFCHALDSLRLLSEAEEAVAFGRFGVHVCDHFGLAKARVLGLEVLGQCLAGHTCVQVPNVDLKVALGLWGRQSSVMACPV